jgi:hypothetical protein
MSSGRVLSAALSRAGSGLRRSRASANASAASSTSIRELPDRPDKPPRQRRRQDLAQYRSARVRLRARARRHDQGSGMVGEVQRHARNRVLNFRGSRTTVSAQQAVALAWVVPLPWKWTVFPDAASDQCRPEGILTRTVPHVVPREAFRKVRTEQTSGTIPRMGNDRGSECRSYACPAVCRVFVSPWAARAQRGSGVVDRVGPIAQEALIFLSLLRRACNDWCQ